MVTVPDAARNNAEWCDLMCGTHGSAGVFDRMAWTSPRRTPVLNPDAVTLLPEPARAAVLDRVDATRGCSVKDSFACLDLSEDGFEPIIEARWIGRPAGLRAPSSPVPWAAVRTAAGLAERAAAWAGGRADLFLPELLTYPPVRVLAVCREGRRWPVPW